MNLAKYRWALLVFATLVSSAYAEQSNEPAVNDKPHPCSQYRSSIDSAAVAWSQIKLNTAVCRVTVWANGLFGDANAEMVAGRTGGTVTLGYYRSDFTGGKPTYQFRANLVLPNLNDRFNAFVGRDNPNKVQTGSQTNYSALSPIPGVGSDDEFFAGVGYRVSKTDWFGANVSAGVSGTTLYVRNRNYWAFHRTKRSYATLTARPFWTSDLGYGVTLGVHGNRILTPKAALQSSVSWTYSEKIRGRSWGSNLAMVHRLPEGRAGGYMAFVQGGQSNPVPIFDYGLRAFAIQPLVPQVAYLSLLVTYSWPKVQVGATREPSVGAGAFIEVAFGPGAKLGY